MIGEGVLEHNDARNSCLQPPSQTRRIPRHRDNTETPELKYSMVLLALDGRACTGRTIAGPIGEKPSRSFLSPWRHARVLPLRPPLEHSRYRVVVGSSPSACTATQDTASCFTLHATGKRSPPSPSQPSQQRMRHVHHLPQSKWQRHAIPAGRKWCRSYLRRAPGQQ